jgi:hypothetical protein
LCGAVSRLPENVLVLRRILHGDFANVADDCLFCSVCFCPCDVEHEKGHTVKTAAEVVAETRSEIGRKLRVLEDKKESLSGLLLATAKKHAVVDVAQEAKVDELKAGVKEIVALLEAKAKELEAAIMYVDLD